MTNKARPTQRPDGVLALLAAVLVLLATALLGAPASAVSPSAIQNGVGASTPHLINIVGPATDIGAGQRLGKTVLQPVIVVATGVAAKTGTRFGEFAADDLRAAAQAPDRNGLTQVGRGLQKHSGREGSVFNGLSSGSAADRNEQGLKVLDDILNDSDGSTEVLDRVTNIFDSSGRGVRFGNDGSFMGFLEPRG